MADHPGEGLRALSLPRADQQPRRGAGTDGVLAWARPGWLVRHQRDAGDPRDPRRLRRPRWVQQDGCEGFGAADVLPYYQKLETDADFGAAPAHGSSGPLPITRSSRARWGGNDAAIYDACVELGYGEVQDHNAFERKLLGMSAFARNDLEPEDGKPSTDGANRAGAGRAGRISAYDAFLAPVRAARAEQVCARLS